METEKELISFIVIVSSGIVLLLMAIIVDFFLLYRRRKTINKQEVELRQRKIDALIRKQEMESVNALLRGQNSERRRIAQELHDRLGGMLFTARLYNVSLEKKLNTGAADCSAGFQRLTSLLDEAVAEVRRISHDLYEGSRANFVYTAALDQLISAIGAALRINTQIDPGAETLSQNVQQELFAITQELLSNTLKHAHARAADIQLKMGPENIYFTYSDNGIGFQSDRAGVGIGLDNIRNRAASLRAEFRMQTSPGKGIRCNLSIPIS